jgi:hypothetical protein
VPSWWRKGRGAVAVVEGKRPVVVEEGKGRHARCDEGKGNAEVCKRR